MMKIVHLSDVHFGRQDAGPLEGLRRALVEIGPDLVIISGDLTQDATHGEFKDVRAFLDALPCKWFCVPGNHDVPTLAWGERFFTPFKRYRTYITPDLAPCMEFEQAIIAGLNSARGALPHWNWANGRLSRGQFAKLAQQLGEADGRWRICVFHHPIHKIEDSPLDVTVFGGKRAMKELARLKVDLVLTGHVHHAAITTLGTPDHHTVYLSASTALSNRLRVQENGFNLITLGRGSFVISHYLYKDGTFSLSNSFTHKREEKKDQAAASASSAG